MTTFNWTISECDRELADGGITTAHWRVNAEQTVGEGDDAVTYTATSYGTCGFTPDPESGDYTPYAGSNSNVTSSSDRRADHAH